VRNMAVLCLTSGARPTGLFPMQNLTDDNRMTLAADAYARHHCAGRSVVEIIDRVLVFMDETRQGCGGGPGGDRGIPARRLAVRARSASSGDGRDEIRCPHSGWARQPPTALRAGPAARRGLFPALGAV
jgi:hypothetical protein